MADPILVAKHRDIECELLPALANRHGLITGATGTGKTITLQALAEQLSRSVVPVTRKYLSVARSRPDNSDRIARERGPWRASVATSFSRGCWSRTTRVFVSMEVRCRQ